MVPTKKFPLNKIWHTLRREALRFPVIRSFCAKISRPSILVHFAGERIPKLHQFLYVKTRNPITDDECIKTRVLCRTICRNETEYSVLVTNIFRKLSHIRTKLTHYVF